MRFFVDTNIWVFCLRGRSREAWTRLNQQPPKRIVLALQTYAELRLGVEKCARPAEELARLQVVIAPYAVVLPTRVTAERYAAIRADLEQCGLSISEQALWVDAVALEEGG